MFFFEYIPYPSAIAYIYHIRYEHNLIMLASVKTFFNQVQVRLGGSTL